MEIGRGRSRNVRARPPRRIAPAAAYCPSGGLTALGRFGTLRQLRRGSGNAPQWARRRSRRHYFMLERPR